MKLINMIGCRDKALHIHDTYLLFNIKHKKFMYYIDYHPIPGAYFNDDVIPKHHVPRKAPWL